jgi:hypothetical protein
MIEARIGHGIEQLHQWIQVRNAIETEEFAAEVAYNRDSERVCLLLCMKAIR